MPGLSDIPPEIQQTIFIYLDGNSCENVRRTCKRYHSMLFKNRKYMPCRRIDFTVNVKHLPSVLSKPRIECSFSRTVRVPRENSKEVFTNTFRFVQIKNDDVDRNEEFEGVLLAIKQSDGPSLKVSSLSVGIEAFFSCFLEKSLRVHFEHLKLDYLEQDAILAVVNSCKIHGVKFDSASLPSHSRPVDLGILLQLDVKCLGVGPAVTNIEALCKPSNIWHLHLKNTESARSITDEIVRNISDNYLVLRISGQTAASDSALMSLLKKFIRKVEKDSQDVMLAISNNSIGSRKAMIERFFERQFQQLPSGEVMLFNDISSRSGRRYVLKVDDGLTFCSQP